jgi:aspartate dehydrogenase
VKFFMKVGLVGCGRVGSGLASFIRREPINEKIQLSILISRTYDERAKKIVQEHGCLWTADVKAALNGLDLIVEAASVEFVRDWAVAILSSGVDLLVLSSGVFLDQNVWQAARSAAIKANSKIHIPSGAIGAMDVLKAASLTRIDRLVLISRQAPSNLGFSNCQRSEHFPSIEPVTLFEGSAKDAVARYPKHLNIAATILLATSAWDQLTIKLVSDPTVHSAQHELLMEGEFGSLSLKLQHHPTSDSVRVSRMSWQSAVSLLMELCEDKVRIGS